jgi:TPR repeat protein
MRILTLILALVCSSALAELALTPEEIKTGRERFEAQLIKAEQGDSQAQLLVGKFYRDGYIKPPTRKELALYGEVGLFWKDKIPRDTNKAIKWWISAAEKGNVEAQIELGDFYSTDSAEFFIPLKVLDEIGEQLTGINRDLENKIKDTQTDYALAEKWYRKASDQGNSRAQYSLGKLFFKERPGVKIEFEEAISLLKLSAIKGESASREFLDYMYTHGSAPYKNASVGIVTKDIASAYAYRVNIELSDDAKPPFYYTTYKALEAEMNAKQIIEAKLLAIDIRDEIAAYESSINPLPERILRYLQRFLRDWYADLKNYSYGPSALRKDAFSVSEKQLLECQKLALNGDARAQYLVGICYEAGLGVIKNKTEAYAYYKLASTSIAEAEQKISNLEKSINFEVYISGQNRAKELQKQITTKREKK